jgi:hypothetical protein
VVDKISAAMLKVLGIVGPAPGGETFHQDVVNNPHGYSAQTKCGPVLLSLGIPK